MAQTAVLIETTDNVVKAANFGVLTAARTGGELCALLLDSNPAECKEVLERYGVKRIVAINGTSPGFATRPDAKAQAIIAAMKEFGLSDLVGLGSSTGKDLLARVAAKLGAPLAVDCLSVDVNARTVRKPYFSGKTVATLRLKGNFFLAAIRPNAVEPMVSPATAEVIPFSVAATGAEKMVVQEIKKSAAGKVDLTEANIIISGGGAMGSAENFKILDHCAVRLNGAVGASRVAVDSGYASHSMQVGQTGKIVSPRLYIACGISGSVQHFAGMKTSKIIVAINTDKDAPILGKCDYAILGDLFEVVPALAEAMG